MPGGALVYSTTVPLPPLAPVFLALVAALIAAVIFDLKLRVVPVSLWIPALAALWSLRFWREGVGDAATGLVSGVIGAAGAWAPFALLAWKGRGFETSDARVASLVGAGFGWPLVMSALLFISLCGALQAVLTLLWNGQLASRLVTMLRRSSAATVVKLPYSVAMLFGSLWTMWWQMETGA